MLTKDATAEPKRWLGAQTTSADGEVTITDAPSKESVSFKLADATNDGAVTIEVDGYGKGAIVPMTAADWKKVAEVEELGKTLGTVVNTVGVLEDGTVNINADTYGKGVLVKMTVADRLILDELLDQMAKQ